MAEILYGKPAAEAIRAALAPRVEALAQRGIRPRLAIVRVGGRPDDLAYESSICRACEKLGCEAQLVTLPADCGQEALLRQIEAVNADDGIHGCLLLRPLPRTIDSAAVCDALRAAKDLDGMGRASLGGLFAGRGDAFAPCTAQSCMELLRYYGIDPAGRRAVVVGRSLVIGRPVAQLLLAADATVTLCHSKSPDLPALCREADILVAAAGRAGLIGAEHLREGQILLDVGVNSANGALCGDLRFDECAQKAAALSPVPGGVGTVTTAVLLAHLVQAAERV